MPLSVTLNPLWWGKVFCLALPWYLNLQLLFLAGFPFFFRVCSRLHDRGYALAKAMGLVTSCYLAWLLAYGFKIGPYSLVPFGYRTVAAGAVVLGLVSVVSLLFALNDILLFLRRNWKLVLLYEALFAGAFLLMLLIRTYNPQITYVINDWAAEKPTDFAVMNSILTSDTMPPHDAWVSGHFLNYYYFGHFLWASMTKLTGERPEIAFNLALASIFALTVVQSFSLGYNVSRRWRWGLLSLFLITLASNLDGFLQLVGIIKESIFDGLSVHPWYKEYSFWRSSRAIEHTINEFPMFSFVLGDLHAHLSSLVIFLAGVGLSLQALRSLRASRSLLDYELRHINELFALALVGGCLYAANSWDAITFLGFLGVVFWAGRRRIRTGGREQWGERPPSIWWIVGRQVAFAVEAAILSGILVIVGGKMLFFLLFNRHFEPPFDHYVTFWHFRALCPFKLVMPSNRSSTIEYCAHWALLAVPILALCAAWTCRRIRIGMKAFPSDAASFSERLATGVFLAMALCGVLFAFTAGWVVSISVTLVLVILWQMSTHEMAPGPRIIWGLLALFLAFSAFCELVYLDDIFEGEIERINTVFKIYYGLWTLMALACVMALRRVVRYAPARCRVRRGFATIAPMIIIGGIYPIAATLERSRGMEERPELSHTSAADALDGMRFLRELQPDDFAGIQFVRGELPTTATLLEAPGAQYQYNGRFATYTGRPSLGGWLTHAWAWRGARFENEREVRTEEARKIYMTVSAHKAYALLRARQIQYVIVGELERELYPGLYELKFDSIADVVFRHGRTIIYRVREDANPPMDEKPEPEYSGRNSVDTDESITTESLPGDTPTTRAE